MRKSAEQRKLKLSKLTLRNLSDHGLQQVAGRDYLSLRGCSWGCDPADSDLFGSCNHCGEEA
jgi:hypothetical protein